MRRTMDATFLNEVANHPSVRPMLGGEGDLDLSAQLADPRNVALENGHGGFVFLKQDDGRYDLHTLFLKEGGGRALIDAAVFAARYLFTQTDCVEIVTRCPEPNRAADFMVRRCGFRPIFERPNAWREGEGIRYFWLSFEDWRAQDPVIAAEGRAFHDLIDAAKEANGSDLPTHPDDEAHDRAAGASALMAKAGQIRKAVRTYNRWAALAGYAPASLLSEVPPIVDIQDAVLGLREGELEVMLCR